MVACAAQSPASVATAPSPSALDVQASAVQSASPSTTAEMPPVAAESGTDTPAICGIGTESEVADEILARSGRGLLWLIMPGEVRPQEADQDPEGIMALGAEEVRSARTLAECLLAHHNADFDPTQSKGFGVFETWLEAHVGPEHPHTLLSAGAAYMASLLVAESGVDALLDVPTARLLLERANAADPRLRDGLGPLLLGAYECFVPKPLGGQPETGLQRLQTAASHSEDLSLVMKVVAAELCAYSLQDRALFDRLLAEVLDQGAASSAFDSLAQQRAVTVRDQVDDLFIE